VWLPGVWVEAVKKTTLDRIVGLVDDMIMVVRDAMHADEMPAWRGDNIINALLDARHAATEKPPVKVKA
jgi:hypothetical protein